MESSLRMGRAEWLLFLLLALLWGSSFLFMKIAVQTMPVFSVVLGRIGIAAILLTVYVYVKGEALPADLPMWGRLILLGFLRAGLPITLFVWAGSQIDSNLSGILNSTTPLFSAIVAHYFTSDERMSWPRIIGILLGMIGVTIIIGPTALQGLGSNFWGQLAVLAATFSYGLAGVYGRRFGQLPVTVTTAGFLIGGALPILPLAIFLEQPWTISPSWASIGSVIALAVFNTAIAFLIWTTLIRRAGATATAQVTFVIPIISIVLGYFILSEQIAWTALIGLVFILFGLAVSQNKLSLGRR